MRRYIRYIQQIRIDRGDGVFILFGKPVSQGIDYRLFKWLPANNRKDVNFFVPHSEYKQRMNAVIKYLSGMGGAMSISEANYVYDVHT